MADGVRHIGGGHLQVILVGDFYQLPPVVKAAEPVFAFQGRTWQALRLLPVHLQKVRAPHAHYLHPYYGDTPPLKKLIRPPNIYGRRK
eukprot:3394721-Pyramimonas_sp.AAC.2